MNKLQNLFIGKYLAAQTDPFERAKIILSFRFSLIYLLLSLPPICFTFIFQRMDLLFLQCALLVLDIFSLVSISKVRSYRLGSVFLAVSCMGSAVGYSLLSSANTSLILFIWPIIAAVFLNFTMGNIWALWHICGFAVAVIAISCMRVFGIMPIDPVADIRINYSTGFIIVIACIILYQLLVQFNLTRNAAIQAQIASGEDRDNIIHLVAHDLRNSFTAIIAGTDLLQNALSGKGNTDYTTLLDVISRASNGALALIQNLLDAASIKKTGIPLDKKNTDLRALIKEIVEQYGPVAENKKIALAFEPNCRNCSAFIDPERIKRVISNLISNAIKFTLPGGAVRLSLFETAGHLQVVVKDSGIGIPKSLQSELFNQYTPACRKGTNGERSTGLGMYITKTLLDLHGAPIHLSSEENKGTTISFDLPAAVEVGAGVSG
jgi:signal transduction histidine kinase